MPDSNVPAVGAKAPGFDLPAFPVGRHKLSQFNGKQNVVLYFYPRDDTLGCTTEACEFRDHIGTFQSSETVVLGVKTGWRCRFVSDTPGAIGEGLRSPVFFEDTGGSKQPPVAPECEHAWNVSEALFGASERVRGVSEVAFDASEVLFELSEVVF